MGYLVCVVALILCTSPIHLPGVPADSDTWVYLEVVYNGSPSRAEHAGSCRRMAGCVLSALVIGKSGLMCFLVLSGNRASSRAHPVAIWAPADMDLFPYCPVISHVIFPQCQLLVSCLQPLTNCSVHSL